MSRHCRRGKQGPKPRDLQRANERMRNRKRWTAVERALRGRLPLVALLPGEGVLVTGALIAGLWLGVGVMALAGWMVGA